MRTGLALASDPDGHRHVLASATRRPGPRAGWQGLADLGTGGRAGSFARLVAPTRIDDEAQLADLIAHLVPLPPPIADGDDLASDADARELDVVDVIDLTGGPPLPERIAAPGGRDLRLRRGSAPSDLDGRALLFANERAPGGAWWAPVGATPPEIDGLGELLARAGLFGPAVRSGRAGRFASSVLEPLGASSSTAPDARDADLARLAIVLETRLRGAAESQGAVAHDSAIRASLDRRVASAPVKWTFATGSVDEIGAGDERSATFESADWRPSAITDLDAARDARLFPYWLLVFEADAHGRLRFTRAENARRRLAAKGPTTAPESAPVWVLEEDL
ncbi:hypothetical protein [Planctomycetes bacterium Pla163]|uniref:hypothetical protein n=1 Tax=Rohdeia mirabilis TaxID=2528008 RepID=UPI0011A2AD2E